MSTHAESITRNTLFYGNHLPTLRRSIPTESVDLTYLALPFNDAASLPGRCDG